VTGRIDYNRTPPTTVNYITFNSRTRANLFLVENLHLVLASAIAGEINGDFSFAFHPDKDSAPLFKEIPAHHIVPMSSPPVSFKLEDSTDDIDEKLETAGIEVRVLKGKGRLYVGPINQEIAMLLDTLPVISDVVPAGGSISPNGLVIFSEIKKIVSTIAQGLDIACDRIKGKTGVRIIEYGDYTKQKVSVHNVSDLSEKTKAKDTNVSMQPPNDVSSDVIAFRSRNKIWGDVTELPPNLQNGLFCPFEPNYSAIDARAITSLLAEFHCVVAENGEFSSFEEKIIEIWRKELSSTTEGEFLAHMIAVLIFCKKVFAQPFFIISNNVYEGAVVHGAEEFEVRMMGGHTTKSLSRTALLEDINKYSFHTSTLMEILQRMKVVGADASKVTSMRHLRKLIYGANNFAIPSGELLWLEKRAMYLNFREKPEGVNIGSLRKFMDFINPSKSIPIPDSVYMDRAALTKTSDTEVAIAMFGRFAPSPIGSGQSYIVAVPSTQDQSKVSTPPMTLQFVIKELTAAAADWDSFKKGGKVAMQTLKTKRGRQFRGEDGKMVWTELKTLSLDSFKASREVAKDTVRDGKRKAQERDDRNEGEEEGSSNVVVKKSKFSFAATFAKSMEEGEI
jgi:hypothetical protein